MCYAPSGVSIPTENVISLGRLMAQGIGVDVVVASGGAGVSEEERGAKTGVSLSSLGVVAWLEDDLLFRLSGLVRVNQDILGLQGLRL